MAQAEQAPTFDQANKLLSVRQEEQKQCEREVAIIRSEVERITKLYEEKQSQLRAADSELWAKRAREGTGLDQLEEGLAMDIERERQEREREIREIIHGMVKKRIPLAPQGGSGSSEVKRNQTLFVHSVKVNYIKNLKDGDIERFTKAQARTAVFRITQSTTLIDLRKTVCEFWVISSQVIEHPEIMSLRANNMAFLDLLSKEERQDEKALRAIKETTIPLYKLFADNKLFPELWLIETNPQSPRLFPNQEDFCNF